MDKMKRSDLTLILSLITTQIFLFKNSLKAAKVISCEWGETDIFQMTPIYDSRTIKF
jgi:hypothetical protein